MAKKNQRTCLGCLKKTNKDELVRIVLNDGKLEIDKNKKMQNSRGAYVCSNLECIKKLKKNKRLNKSFKMKVLDDIYLSLEQYIQKENT